MKDEARGAVSGSVGKKRSSEEHHPNPGLGKKHSSGGHPISPDMPRDYAITLDERTGYFILPVKPLMTKMQFTCDSMGYVHVVEIDWGKE